MSNSYIFSSESVTEGHPDKVCDTVSDAILDACFEQDTASRVACETMVKDNMVILGGEITTNSVFDHREVAKKALVTPTNVLLLLKLFTSRICSVSNRSTSNKVWTLKKPLIKVTRNREPAIRASCSVTPVRRPNR